MFFFSGATCDGQYIASKDFAIQVAKRANAINDDAFSIPIRWDPAHLFNLAVTDIREGKGGTDSSGKHLQRFVKRSAVFNAEMNIGKGNATLGFVAKQSQKSAHAPSAYAKQRYLLHFMLFSLDLILW